MLNTLFNTSHTILMGVMVKGKLDPLLRRVKFPDFIIQVPLSLKTEPWWYKLLGENVW